MSKADILDQLPTLASNDRQEIFDRLCELQDLELHDTHQKWVGEALASGPAKPGTAADWDGALQRGLASGAGTPVRTIFRPRFWLDVEEGVAYLAAKSGPEVARQWHEAVMTAVKRVENQPDLGRLRRDLLPIGIRSLVLRRFPRYLLF